MSSTLTELKEWSSHSFRRWSAASLRCDRLSLVHSDILLAVRRIGQTCVRALNMDRQSKLQCYGMHPSREVFKERLGCHLAPRRTNLQQMLCYVPIEHVPLDGCVPIEGKTVSYRNEAYKNAWTRCERVRNTKSNTIENIKKNQA